jgi:hypothetical protein
MYAIYQSTAEEKFIPVLFASEARIDPPDPMAERFVPPVETRISQVRVPFRLDVPSDIRDLRDSVETNPPSAIRIGTIRSSESPTEKRRLDLVEPITAESLRVLEEKLDAVPVPLDAPSGMPPMAPQETVGESASRYYYWWPWWPWWKWPPPPPNPATITS